MKMFKAVATRIDTGISISHTNQIMLMQYVKQAISSHDLIVVRLVASRQNEVDDMSYNFIAFDDITSAAKLFF